MISTFRSKALAAYWNDADASKLPADSLNRLRTVMQALHAAPVPEDLNLPGYRFHRLSGCDKGRFSVRITANWRLTFAWEHPDAVRADFEICH